MNGKKILFLQRLPIYKHTRMIKHILFTLLLSLGLFGMMPRAVAAEVDIESPAPDFPDINVYIQGTVLHVVGAAGQNLNIYDITGVRVMAVKVDGSDKSYNLSLPRGCYIVKVGNVVRKISLK